MNLFHFLDGNTALVLSVLTAYFIPLVSGLIVRVPNTTLEGILTSLISALSAFLAEWAANPHHYDWKAGASTAVLAWIVATKAHSKTWAGGSVLAAAHSVNAKATTTSEPAAAVQG